ncbi:MAG: lytic transglycosylase domain-containing protein [Caulobacteraceae bacterium]
MIEVHVDGSVVTYDGATQHASPGAEPTARLISPRPRAKRRHGGHVRAMPAPPPAMAQAIHAAADRHQVNERLVEAVAWRESGYNPHAVSKKGARGTMQLMPRTARALGVDIADPDSNIDGGAEYLAHMMSRFDGDEAKALAAYNAGPEAVARYHGVPPYAETRAYVHSILGHVSGPDTAVADDLVTLKARMGAF